jgi:arabinogalactan endo-1,4-beta-galactosidase
VHTLPSATRSDASTPGSRTLAGLIALCLSCIAAGTGCGGSLTTRANPAIAPIAIVGADVSTLLAVEGAGAVFSENGVRDDALAILKRNGFGYARLRLFHTPDRSRELVNDATYDVTLAKRVKNAGLKLLLDIHYSDSWADPGKQTKPAAWTNLTFDQLRDSVFAYTRDVVAAFRDAGAPPDMIQIGNEVNTGMLWPDGHADKLDAEWARFALLVKAGRDGARAALGSGSGVLFMHHVADPQYVVWHMDNLLRHLEPPDVIGVSYYPFWHGDLTQFRARMSEIAIRYGKPIVIAETAYPWTNESFDAYPDVYHGAPAAGMPAYTRAGQADFFSQLIAAIKATPNGLGAGFFYWEPAWLPSSTFGSPMDNLTLFDQTGAALPALATIRGAVKLRSFLIWPSPDGVFRNADAHTSSPPAWSCHHRSASRAVQQSAPMASTRASSRLAASGKRSALCFSRQRAITAASGCGISGRRSVTGRGFSYRCAAII